VLLEDSEAKRVEDARLAQLRDTPYLLNEAKRAVATQDPVIVERAQRTWRENADGQNRQRESVRRLRSRPVMLNIHGEVLSFPSLREASKYLKVRRETLGMWLRGTRSWPGQGRYLPQGFTHLTGLTGRYLSREEWLAYTETH